MTSRSADDYLADIKEKCVTRTETNCIRILSGSAGACLRAIHQTGGGSQQQAGSCARSQGDLRYRKSWRYPGMGPVPIATTEWNLTQSIACGTEPGTGGCMGVNPSGLLPPVEGTAANGNVYLQGELTLTANGATAGTIGPFPAGR